MSYTIIGGYGGCIVSGAETLDEARTRAQEMANSTGYAAQISQDLEQVAPSHDAEPRRAFVIMGDRAVEIGGR
jgi:hypothetical protein